VFILNKRIIFFSACLFFFCFEKNYAQDSRDTLSLLDEIIVTATKSAIKRSKLPYAVSTIDKERMSTQLSRTIPESLSGLPGVFIQKTNHAGGSPFIRGLTGNQTLILVDGIRLNNSIFRYGPNQYMTLVDPFIVDKIDLAKGTGSVQYGSDAMTGVINVHTTALSLKSKPQWNESLHTRYVTDGMELSARPELKYEGKKLAFVIGASTKKFGDLKGGDTTGFQRPSGYDERSFDAKLLIDLGEGWEMRAAYQFLQQINVPVYHKYILENFMINTSDPLSRGFGYLKVEKKYNKRHLKSINLFVSSQNIKDQRFIQKNASNIFRSEKDIVSTVSGGADLQISMFNWWSSNSGLEIFADGISSKRIDKNIVTGLYDRLRGLYPDRSSFFNGALYNLNHFQFGKLSGEGGLRYNIYKASLFDDVLGGVVLSPKALVFQGGLNYMLSDRFHIYSNVSQGFRAPNLDDLGTLGIVDFRFEVPAYDLRPERSLNKEFGVKYLSKKLSSELSFFETRLYDLITRIKTNEVNSGYDVYKKINVDKAYVRGWEMQLKYLLFKKFSVYANATYLYGNSITRKEPLRRIPPFNGRLVLEYFKGNVVSGISFDHASHQSRLAAADKADNRIPVGGTPGFNIVNMYAGFQGKSITLRAYFNNLFNVDYRTHGSGINGIGRSIGLTSSIRIVQVKKLTSLSRE